MSVTNKCTDNDEKIMASSNSEVQPGHARTYFGSGKLTSFVLAWLSCSQLAQSLEPKTLPRFPPVTTLKQKMLEVRLHLVDRDSSNGL